MREALERRNMEDSRRTFLARLIGRLRDHQSWTGETHIQKSMFFLQELLGCKLGYGFYLYHYGPYCYDIYEVMQFMLMFGEIRAEDRSPYRPQYQLTKSGQLLAGRLADDDNRIDWVSRMLGPKRVADLEGPSTALLLRRQRPDRSDADTAAEINRLKPHISVPAAMHAIRELDELRSRAREDGLIASAS